MVNYAEAEGSEKAENLLHKVFQTIPALNPSKNAIDYWLAVNRTILDYSGIIQELWEIEKKAATESIEIGKTEGLTYLACE